MVSACRPNWEGVDARSAQGVSLSILKNKPIETRPTWLVGEGGEGGHAYNKSTEWL